MDYKEKYNAALERAEILIEKLESTHIKGFIYHIFPELKESKDKRIRKWLEELIEAMPDNSIEFKELKRIDVLHWLEKQGENKPTENESKALDADKVIAWLVANITDFRYYVRLFKKDFGL